MFTVANWFSQGGLATTADIVDVGVPATQNLTGYSIRLVRISLVAVPPAVRLLSVIAYPPGPGVGVMVGNLLKDCPQDKPYPLTDDVTAPHAVGQWKVVLAIRFARPGTYALERVKIFYTADGHSGWQYQDLSTTMTIKLAPKGAKSQLTGCLP